MGNPGFDKLLDYLHDAADNTAYAMLDVSGLPGDFQDFASQLKHFVENVIESKMFALALSQGDLHCKTPSRGNELAAPLKSLHASLKHMTWQARQVAKGDYSQRVRFPGEFAEAFNQMAQQLEERSVFEVKERSRLLDYINLILANTPDMLVVFDKTGRAILASRAYVENSRFSGAMEVRGKTFGELFAPVATDVFLHQMNDTFIRAVDDKCTYDVVHSMSLRKDGEPRTYNIHVTPMLFEDDVVVGIMIIFHDITDTVPSGVCRLVCQ